MSWKKKAVSLLLAGCIMFSAVPLAFADEPIANAEKTIEIIASGNCGDLNVNEGKDVTWTLDDKGTLTISGKGDMKPRLFEDFKDPMSVKKIIVEHGVISIGDFAFSGFQEVRNVTISDSVKIIGEGAFQTCSMKEVTIPDNVEIIRNIAFKDCSQLLNITIGSGVIEIGDGVFGGCRNLSSIILNSNNQYFCVEGNALFDKYKTRLIRILSIYGKYEVPDTVKIISSEAASGCTGLTEIIIPDNVEQISECAFMYCYGLTKATIGTGVEGISKYMFSDCVGLKEITITIPSNIKSIEQGAFSGCASLESINIPDSVEKIQEDAFFQCTSLKTVKIGSGTSWIGDKEGLNPFGWCPKLESIEIDPSNSSYCVYENALFDQNKKTLICAFGVNGTYTIPENVETIGGFAFCGCNRLTNIENLDGVKHIYRYAFFDCNNLTSVVIPSSIEEIRYNAFSSSIFNSKSKKIYFKGTLPQLSDCIFEYMNITVYYPKDIVLENETNFTQTCGGNVIWETWNPASTPEESPKIVESGTCGTSLTWTLDEYGVLNINGSGKMNNYTDSNIPLWDPESIKEIIIGDGVTSIGDYAFQNCINLTEITIGNSVQSIGKYAFHTCKGLREIQIPENVTSIGEEAFSGCGLTRVEIPNSLERISKGMFSGCPLEGIVIPNSVTSIGEQAFSVCPLLTTITIPDSVTSIGDAAFRSCDSLKGITIGKSVENIGIGVFRDCSGLVSVVVNSDNYVIDSSNGNEILFDKDHTTLVYATSVSGVYSVPEKVKYIYDGAFANKFYLTGITIPSSVTKIDDFAFEDCNNLKSIIVDPNNPSYCSENNTLFSKDKSTLIFVATGSAEKEFIMPNYVNIINQNAFSKCNRLESIEISSGVNLIGNNAFLGCSELKEIWFKGNAPSFQTEQGDIVGESGESINELSVEKNYNATLGNEDGIFGGVKATAYYPEGDTTWTGDIMQNYGGNITWESWNPDEADDSNGDNTTPSEPNTPNAPDPQEPTPPDTQTPSTPNTPNTPTPSTPSTPSTSTPNIPSTPTTPESPDTPGNDTPDIPDTPSKSVTDIFTDVADDWYTEFIQYMYDKGLMVGLSDTVFGTNTTVSRAMIAQILYANADKPKATEMSKFTDVPSGEWYTEAVTWAANNGIVAGYGDTTFRPNRAVTREELAAMLYGAAGKTPVTGSLGDYPDRFDVSEWAKSAVLWATQNDIITGDTSGTKIVLNPKNNATRAQLAAMIMQYIEK